MLGVVPHAEVYALMRQSVALLQPSLFEGWSTSVEEAKSLGKRVILSDIAVHREQDPPQARLFAPSDAEALAGCLVEAFATSKPGPDHALEAAARAQLPVRTRAFGTAFVTIVQEVVGRSTQHSGLSHSGLR
jgi:glycosyltransferase involved in cell wall biosynthesis